MKTVYKLVCGLVDPKDEPKTLVARKNYDSIESAKKDILNFVQGVKCYRVYVGREDIVERYDDNKLLTSLTTFLTRAEDHYYTDIQEDGSLGDMREVLFDD